MTKFLKFRRGYLWYHGEFGVKAFFTTSILSIAPLKRPKSLLQLVEKILKFPGTLAFMIHEKRKKSSAGS